MKQKNIDIKTFSHDNAGNNHFYVGKANCKFQISNCIRHFYANNYNIISI